MSVVAHATASTRLQRAAVAVEVVVDEVLSGLNTNIESSRTESTVRPASTSRCSASGRDPQVGSCRARRPTPRRPACRGRAEAVVLVVRHRRAGDRVRESSVNIVVEMAPQQEAVGGVEALAAHGTRRCIEQLEFGCPPDPHRMPVGSSTGLSGSTKPRSHTICCPVRLHTALKKSGGGGSQGRRIYAAIGGGHRRRRHHESITAVAAATSVQRGNAIEVKPISEPPACCPDDRRHCFHRPPSVRVALRG